MKRRGMDRYPHCGLVVDSVGMEIDPGRRTVRFDPVVGVKWIRKANSDGAEMVTDRARSGRPLVLIQDVLNKLDEVLSKSPQDFESPGQNGTVWFLWNI